MCCCLCAAAVAVNAGCEALPALLNIKQVMIQRQVSYSAFFDYSHLSSKAYLVGVFFLYERTFVLILNSSPPPPPFYTVRLS
jgi:hypothetical protein